MTWLCCSGWPLKCTWASRVALCSLVLFTARALEPSAAQVSQQRDIEQNASLAIDRRLQIYIEIQWTPAQVFPPPGGGAAALFAGTNYTKFKLVSANPTTNTGRVKLVSPTAMNGQAEYIAIIGECLKPDYEYVDVLPPLNSTGVFTNHEWNSPPKDPIKFTQGGVFHLCWSEGGTFGIGDGYIIPFATSTIRVFGVRDSCSMYSWCLASRRFFCTQIHAYYAHYLPTGTKCQVFAQAAEGLLLYQRMTWSEGVTCATPPGKNMVDSATYVPGVDKPWMKLADPLDLIYLGESRRDLTNGFHYLLCYCPAYDHYVDGVFGVCGVYEDFVQQIGHLSGLMASYINVSREAVVQIVPMTRFTVKVDCGNGPYCDTDGLERIKLIPRSWNPNHGTSEDGVFWNTSTTCPEQIEVSAWYSPNNCETNGIKTSDNCQMTGGTDPSIKLFGPDEVRIWPLLENNRPVSQIFQICFVHKPMVPPSSYDPVSDESLQGNTRRFWKLSELVVEPLLLYDWDQWVIHKTATLRVGTADLVRSNNLHASSLLKVVEEDRTYFENIDNRRCALKTTRELHLDGISCITPDSCTPKASNIGSELVITDVTIKKAGVFAVCYCEGWSLEADACSNADHWVLVGKFQVSGPMSNEEWILDTGMVQSFFISGFGFTDASVIRILEPGQSCNQIGLEKVEPEICIFRKGECLYQGNETNATHMADIPGMLQRWNSTNPPAVIESITEFEGDKALVNFANIPVVDYNDILMFDDNIYSTAPHFVRSRDLTRLIRGRPEGHEILDFRNAGLSAVIRMTTRPLPPVIIDPPAYGKWYRSTKTKVMWLKGRKERSQLPVCWGSTPGEYLTWAGFINVIDPVFMSRVTMGLTSTAAGTTAPVMISFWTSQNPLLREPRNPTQLRITIKDSSIMQLATAEAFPTIVPELIDADQIHEASQATCGRLIVEMWSEHEFGFPVPQGCYWEYNRYDSDGKIRSLFILFEPLNGLKSQTKYTLVLNMLLKKTMSLAEYDALDETLIEVAALDDILVKPEGIIEIGYVNPDKAVVPPSQHPIKSPRFYNVGDFGNVTGNITVGPSIMGLIDIDGQPLDSSSHPVLNLHSDQVGFSFLLRGEEVANITKLSLIRFFMWPLTAWDLAYGQVCVAKCTPQLNTECDGDLMCTYEAAESECLDVVPPSAKFWTDNRGRTCDWYQFGERCAQDGRYYTPSSGIDAVDACCTCNGGVRSNANVVRIRLPRDMTDAFGFQVIHTIRVYRIAPVTPRGFFATRWGAQLTNQDDEYPHYTTTTSAYFAKTPDPGSYSTVSTLLGVDTWGNSRPFAAEQNLNDFYLRIQFPITVYGVTGYGNPTGASLTITMPKGFQCKYVHPAVPRGGGDDKVAMPVLPTDPPNGNGALPDSTTGEGNALGYNSSAIIIGTPSGQWEFVENKCIFLFSPYTVYHEKQTLYAHIFGINPTLPMPYEDPDNFWTVEFTSRGNAGKPSGIVDTAPCGGQQVNNPPFCYETGVDYYVNPLGYPVATQSYLTLWPTADSLSTLFGPYRVEDMDGDEFNRTWTDRFVVLGRLSEIVGQPRRFHLGVTTVMQFWFVPDLGSHRNGILSITFPTSFVVDDPCDAHDLPHTYYSTFAPPFDRVLSERVFYHTTFPKIWPLDEITSCGRLTAANTAAIAVDGALVSGRYYGFEIVVTTPSMSDAAAFASNFVFKLFIRDNYGRERDGTYTTAVFDPRTTAPKVELGDAARLYYTGVRKPITVAMTNMMPFVFTNDVTTIQILNISFNSSVRGRLRVTAPLGFNWSWGDFFIDGLPGQTRPMPDGIPPLPSTQKPNIIEWNTGNILYEAYETYAFETMIRIPPQPVRTSSNKFFFEWGFNGTQAYFNNSENGRTAYASANPPQIQALRGFKVEMSTTVAEETALMWMWFETITPIPRNGSLELYLPMPDQYFENVSKWVTSGGEYIKVYAVEDYDSAPVPVDFQCRRVYYVNAWNRDKTGFQVEIRLEFSSEGSIFEPGRYVLELTTINSNDVARQTVAEDNPCGRRHCYTLYSNIKRSLVDFQLVTSSWVSQQTPFPELYIAQNDYWTSIPAPRITRKMKICQIVDMPAPEFLDVRLAIGRNDRPAQRSALVFAFMLDAYFSNSDDVLDIRAPIGFLFDSICDFYVNDDVYPVAPGSTGMPPFYRPNNGSQEYSVTPWPTMAPPTKCRGDNHLARIWFGRGLIPRLLYMFRITLRRNPILTPDRNTWMVSYGGESSGEIPGYPIWTFPDSYLDPISLAWTIKPDPQRSPVVFHFMPVNTLRRWNPPLAPSETLQPLLRIIMPPLYELLVDAEDQDIQGGNCFAVIQEVGDCRMCGAPFRNHTYSCTREWNRKNVARIKLLDDTTIYSGRWYSIAITLFNPHIVDAVELVPRHWVVESFLGLPWPLEQPKGYELDHRNVSGYKIAEKALLTVETPAERNGSAFVYDKEISFQLVAAITEENEIVLRAPVGFVTSTVIRGLVDRIVCLGIQPSSPAIYRTERDPATGNDTVVLPIERPPIENPLPDWANNTAIIESEIEANLSNVTGTIWEFYNYTVTRPYCLVDRWRDTSLTVNDTNVISDNFNWLDPPVGVVLNMTIDRDINKTLFPGMVELCLVARWSDFRLDVNATSNANLLGCDPCCHLRSSVGFRLERDLICCAAATISQYNLADICTTESSQYTKQLCTLMAASHIPPAADLIRFRVVENPYSHIVPRLETGRGVARDRFGNLPYGAFDASIIGIQPPSRRLQSPIATDGEAATMLPYSSYNAKTCEVADQVFDLRDASATEDDCKAKCVELSTCLAFSGIWEQWCTGCSGAPTLTNEATPAALGFRKLEAGGWARLAVVCSNCTNTTIRTTTTTTTGPEICIGGLAVHIFWATTVNLSRVLENWTAVRNHALTMENWDRYPLQGQPVCSGRKWTWTVRREDMHPDGLHMLNGTRLFFRISYQNARRPPLYHENFWTIRHYRIITNVGPFAGKLQVSSSAAVLSWTIVSRLRYVNLEMLSEVLRPDDTAQFHFEFVTVNLADRLKIVAHTPEGFDFTQAVMSSPFDEVEERRLGGGAELVYKSSQRPPRNKSRRLIEFETPYTWKGYTRGINIISAAGNTIELSCDLARDEYTRFRISGIKIPWLGGQSQFDFVSTLYNEPADSMYNCCPPGYPANNPGYSPKMPYRMSPLDSVIRNGYQQKPLVFPVLSLLETRFAEITVVSFVFQIPSPHRSVVPGAFLVVVVRAPQGYVFTEEIEPLFQDSSGCVRINPDDVCGLISRAVLIWREGPRRKEIALLDLSEMTVGTEYRTELQVNTPESIFDRADPSSPESLWVLELNDANSIDNGKVSTTLGAPVDFVLKDTVNFTAIAPDTPPDTIVTVNITFKDAGEIPPTNVQVYAPQGYTFLYDCFAPGMNEEQELFVSCRERWSLFGAQYFSGAVMATGGSGVRRSVLPITVRLLVKTPMETPSENKWFVRAKIRTGPTAWGVVFQPFPVRQMQASVSMLAIAGANVSLFLSAFFRYPLPWGGHVHLVAPKSYKLRCPVTKVLSLTGYEKDSIVCSQSDPLLQGCWGLPAPDDPKGIRPGIPNCDPKHELLLTFPMPTTSTTSTAAAATTLFPLSVIGAEPTTTTTTTTIGGFPYALEAGSSMLLALMAVVPNATPTPRSENMWKIRVLDAGKVTIDGKVNQYGETIRKEPKVNDFSLWWSAPVVPNTVMTIILRFYLNNTREQPFNNELLATFSNSTNNTNNTNFTTITTNNNQDEAVRVIDVQAPEGFAMSVRRPCEIQNLEGDNSVPVMNFSWSTILPRHIWFTLDPDPEAANFAGYFHFSFPVLVPSQEVGMPLENLWRIRLCGDQPYCSQLVLNIPIPGFFLEDRPTFTPAQSIMDKLGCGSLGKGLLPSWKGFVVMALLWWPLYSYA